MKKRLLDAVLICLILVPSTLSCMWRSDDRNSDRNSDNEAFLKHSINYGTYETLDYPFQSLPIKLSSGKKFVLSEDVLEKIASFGGLSVLSSLFWTTKKLFHRKAVKLYMDKNRTELYLEPFFKKYTQDDFRNEKIYLENCKKAKSLAEFLKKYLTNGNVTLVFLEDPEKKDRETYDLMLHTDFLPNFCESFLSKQQKKAVERLRVQRKERVIEAQKIRQEEVANFWKKVGRAITCPIVGCGKMSGKCAKEIVCGSLDCARGCCKCSVEGCGECLEGCGECTECICVRCGELCKGFGECLEGCDECLGERDKCFGGRGEACTDKKQWTCLFFGTIVCSVCTAVIISIAIYLLLPK